MASTATPTASAAAHGNGPASFNTIRPTSVEMRCPPISARGCAAGRSGEPITRTMEGAKGMVASGKLKFADSNSMTPMAIAAPTPAANAVSRNRGLRNFAVRDGLRSEFSATSIFLRSAMHADSRHMPVARQRKRAADLSAALEHPKMDYFRFAAAVRSKPSFAMKVAPHHFEVNAPPAPVDVVAKSLVK